MNWNTSRNSDNSFFHKPNRKQKKKIYRVYSFPLMPILHKRRKHRNKKLQACIENRHMDIMNHEISNCIRNGRFGKKKIYLRDQFDLKKIDCGFYAHIFKATNKSNNKVVIIKYYKRQQDKYSAMCELFLFRMISHKNIVRLLGACLWNNTLYPIFEYVDGGTLEDYYLNIKDLSWAIKISLTSDISDALFYLHSCGYMHRDVTSRNVLIKKTNSKIRISAILIDLGLAITIPTKCHKSVCSVVGSPFFMAPEVLRNDFYNEKADVFSFGIVICGLMASITADPEFLPRTMYYGVDYVAYSKLIRNDCLPDYLNLIFNCCQVKADKRPHFSRISTSLNKIKIMMHSECTMLVLPKSNLRNLSIIRSMNPFCLIKYRYDERFHIENVSHGDITQETVYANPRFKKKICLTKSVSHCRYIFQNEKHIPVEKSNSCPLILLNQTDSTLKRKEKHKKIKVKYEEINRSHFLRTPLTVGQESAKLDEYYAPQTENPFNIPKNSVTKLHKRRILSDAILDSSNYDELLINLSKSTIKENSTSTLNTSSPMMISNKSYSCGDAHSKDSDLTKISFVDTTTDSAIFTLSTNHIFSSISNMQYSCHVGNKCSYLIQHCKDHPRNRLHNCPKKEKLLLKNCFIYPNIHENAAAASVIMVGGGFTNYSKSRDQYEKRESFTYPLTRLSGSLDSLNSLSIDKIRVPLNGLKNSQEISRKRRNAQTQSVKFQQLVSIWEKRQNDESLEENMRKFNENDCDVDICQDKFDSNPSSSTSSSTSFRIKSDNRNLGAYKIKTDEIPKLKNDMFPHATITSVSSCSSVKDILNKFESKCKNKL
ncbi:putative serine/threonine-protein kinase [Intoshia linei]|uniref:dual-specificity kinase n=1 Tax=Intoshia linei TaxID=1819745 RepID=A0A177BC50_9BILA|nr:putative serine/threonine-protein kinase [Intoshia linei]